MRKICEVSERRSILALDVVLIDVDDGDCYSLMAEGANSVPGSSCVLAVISILFLLIIRNRRKKCVQEVW